jgi:hypothetical protein
MEAWTSRGTRPILLGLVAIAILVVGVLAVAHEGHGMFGWHGEGRGGHERSESRSRPEGKAEGKSEGRSEAKPELRSPGRPEAPRPPERPAPPPPPAQ